jgi:hypothetical protein
MGGGGKHIFSTLTTNSRYQRTWAHYARRAQASAGHAAGPQDPGWK